MFLSLFPLDGFLNYPADPPPLGFAQGTCLGNHHSVTDLAGIFLVMRHEIIAAADILFIGRMLNQALNLDHNSPVHLVADDGADHLSSISTCLHMRP
jgi:hypothetical protein